MANQHASSSWEFRTVSRPAGRWAQMEPPTCSSGCPSGPSISALPLDVLVKVFGRLDLLSRLAALCVCTQWRDAGEEPSLWSSIVVPAEKAFRLWDTEFAALVAKCQGRLSHLDVSGSGITGKSLIRLIKAGALAPKVEVLRLNQCCNLKLCDILAFVQAVAPDQGRSCRTPGSSAAPAAGSLTYSRQNSVEADLEDFLGPWGEAPRGRAAGASGGALQLSQVVPAPGPPSVIEKLQVNGCKQMGVWEVTQLQSAVAELDVAVCSCGRVGVLHRCSRGSSNVPRPPQSLSALLALQGRGAHRHGAEVASSERRCPGLCAACAELFKNCGASACGACWQPREGQQVQALRTRLRLWQARREAMTDLRSRWTDFRCGVQQRSVAGNA